MPSGIAYGCLAVIFETVEADFLVAGVVGYRCHQRLLVAIQGGRVYAKGIPVLNLKIEGTVFGDFRRPGPRSLHVVLITQHLWEKDKGGECAVVGYIGVVLVMMSRLISVSNIKVSSEAAVYIGDSKIVFSFVVKLGDSDIFIIIIPHAFVLCRRSL